MGKKNSLSVPMKIGIPCLDSQHETLYQCLNEFIQLSQQKNLALETVKKHFSKISNYTITHFDDEEFFMRSCAYPELDNHSLQHLALRELVGDLAAKLEETDNLQAFCSEMVEVLKDWLNDHICTQDAKIAAFYHSHHK